MNNTFTLFKIEFSRTIASLLTSSKKASKLSSLAYVGVLVILLFSGMFAYTSYLFTSNVIKFGMDVRPTIYIFAGLASMLILVSAINQARGIYIGDDYDLLTTLPLKKSQIIISKLSVLFILELLFSLMTLIPHAIVLVSLTGDVGLMFITFLVALLVPVFPIAIGSLFSLALTIITARFKYANFISIALYFVFFIGVFFFSYLMNNASAINADVLTGMSGSLKYLNPTLLIVELGFNQSLLWLFLFVAANVILLAIVITLFATLFTTLHELTSSIKMKSKYVRKDLKIKNELKTLYGIEMKRLVNSKMYFVNSLMGALMCSISIVISMLSTMKVQDNPETAPYYAMIIIPASIVVAMIVLGITNTASCSINMEGKSFWLTKTLPINMKKYMYAKLLVDFTFFVPASLIASAIMVGFVHEDVLGSIMAFIIPVLFVILSGLVGLEVNSRHIKVKWKNENEAVKSASSTVFTMLYGFLYSIVVGTVMLVLIFVVPNGKYIGYPVAAGILLVLIFVYYLILNKKFEKRINECEEL